MSKMKCGRSPKIDSHTEIISLKRELSMTLGENQLLKVRIRRLEYELKKKDKYMNSFFVNSEKHSENQNLAYKRTSNTIMKLKKENEDLKELLFKNELNDQISPCKTKMTTISSDQVNYKIKNPLRRPQSNFSSKLESLSDSHTLNKNNKKCQRVVSTRSQSIETANDFLNNFVTRTDADKLMEMINVLKKQQDVDKKIIHARNSEISQLASELKDLKSQLSSEKILLLKGSNIPSNLLSSNNVNNNPEQDIQLKNPEFIRPKTPSTGLEPVQEMNENESSDASNKSDIKLDQQKINSPRKIIIEYAIDSDVSSDEEIYLLNA